MPNRVLLKPGDMLDAEFVTRVRRALTYDQYMDQWRAKNDLTMKGLDKVQRRTRFYSKYNLERQELVERKWEMSAEFRQAVIQVSGPLDLLFITDDWCIDSAYSLPMLKSISEMRDDVSLRILMKDDNLDILDLFLTNGTRSIPKLVGLDFSGEVQFVWGPQPEEIRLIRKQLIDSEAEGRIVSGTTIEWYADEGWIPVDTELTALLSG